MTAPPLIELSKTELSRVVTTREIEQLPISGRNFVDFVKLSSGVALERENVGGGAFKEPDVGVGSAAAPRLSFGGEQPELNTLIQVDGADNIQTFTGLPRATPSQEAAKEFRVLNSTYLAEYGRALGGFVNIVTKSGTNQGSGSATTSEWTMALAGAVDSRPARGEHAQPASVRRDLRRPRSPPIALSSSGTTKGSCGSSRTAIRRSFSTTSTRSTPSASRSGSGRRRPIRCSTTTTIRCS